MCLPNGLESPRNRRRCGPRTARALPLLGLAALWLAIGATGAPAQFWSSSRLLLPYFEVDLGHDYQGELHRLPTTHVALVNTSDAPITVRAKLYTDWGIEVLATTFEMDAYAAKTFDLGFWLRTGYLHPDHQLTPEELEHVQAALSGQRSPRNDMFYSSPVMGKRASPLAVGYATFWSMGPPDPDVVTGDFFQIEDEEDYAQGQALLNVDFSDCDKICERHSLRFLEGGFDAGTDLFLWTDEHGVASRDGILPDRYRIETTFIVYDMSGQLLDVITRWLMPLERVRISELFASSDVPPDASFGWIDVTTVEPSFIAVRYGAFGRFSVALKTFCLPFHGKIRIEKRTNGEDADQAPGPSITVGAGVEWTYEVRNTGPVTLTDVKVTDSRGVDVTCTKDTLEPGESMTCTAEGVAEACQYGNIGRVTALTPSGARVGASDPSHYHGEPCPPDEVSILLEKYTNGFDADSPNDLMDDTLKPGDPVTWEYVVTNTGEVTLTGLTVQDNLEGTIAGCATTLSAGQSTTCTKNGTATSTGL